MINENFNLNDLSQYTVDDGPEYGVFIRFKHVPIPRSRKKTLYAYWTHDLAPDFNDAQRFGTIRDVKNPGSIEFLNLVKELIKKEGYVHIYVEDSTIAQDPEEFKKLEKYLDRYKKNRGDINWEFGDPVSQEPTPQIQPKNIPTTAEINPQKKKEYQQELLNAIRADRDLYAKYSSVDNNTRMQMQDAGLQMLAKGVDSYTVVQDLKDVFNINSSMSESSKIRKIINTLNDILKS